MFVWLAPLYEQFPSLFATVMFLLIYTLLYNKELVVYSFYLQLNEWPLTQALSTRHHFLDFPCMYPIQLKNLKECSVLRTPLSRQETYPLSSPLTALYMDNMSYTTMKYYQEYHILRTTLKMPKPIYVKWRYTVSVFFRMLPI